MYGTEFNVNTTGDNTSVVLVKGSVSVTPTGGKEQLMNPGQLCEFSVENLMLSTVDVEPYVAWNVGKFSFDDWSLERVMNVLARWYGYDVQFESEDLQQLPLNGHFSRFEDIQPILESIETVLDVKIRISNNTIFINK